MAVENGSVSIVQTLIRHGALLDVQDEDGQTPLHIAVHHSHKKIIKILLKKGARTDIADNEGTYPLHIVSWNGNNRLVSLLLNANANMVNALDADETSSLSLASEQGHDEVVQNLIQAGASLQPDNRGETPLHKAALFNHPSTLEILLNHIRESKSEWGVDHMDNTKSTPLLCASFVGSLECVKLLYENNANLYQKDEELSTALHKAAYNGHIEIVRFLLDNGIPIDAEDINGATALHKAAFNGETKVIKLLCKYNANVNIRDKQGGVPLHNASYGGHKRATKVLLSYIEKTENVIVQDNDGFNALHMAASQGHVDIVNLLLNIGDNVFDIDLKTNNGWTAVMLALRKKHIKVAKLLIKSGANFDYNNEISKKLRNVPQEMIDKILILKKRLIEEPQNDTSTLEILPFPSKTEKLSERNKKVKRRETTNIIMQKDEKVEDNMCFNSNIDKKSILVKSYNDSLYKRYHPFNLSNDSIKNNSDKILFQRHKALSFTSYSPEKNKTTIINDQIYTTIKNGVEMFSNGQTSKAIEFLIENNILDDNCSSVARFLFYGENIDKTQLGLFLSEGSEWNNSILDSFVQLFDFHLMEFDMALRRFLSKFKLPGEAQKIDRLMEKFAWRYFSQNPGMEPFANQDAVYILAFSVIMLNTDAHNSAIKKQNKMTKAQFIANNAGINGGENFPESFLSELYDKIVMYEIKMESDDIEEFQNAELKGWLTKQGGKIKSWKKRWFVLTENCLFYFKNETDKEPCGIIPLENVIIHRLESKKKYMFTLKSHGDEPIKESSRKGTGYVMYQHESYIFQTSSIDEMNLWINSINKNIYRNPYYQLLDTKKLELEEKIINQK